MAQGHLRLMAPIAMYSKFSRSIERSEQMLLSIEKLY
jgi:hypothetical protein